MIVILFIGTRIPGEDKYGELYFHPVIKCFKFKDMDIPPNNVKQPKDSKYIQLNSKKIKYVRTMSLVLFTSAQNTTLHQNIVRLILNNQPSKKS